MSHVIDDATSTTHDTYDETTFMLDTEQIARSREREIIESEYDDESDDENLPAIPEGYLFDAGSSVKWSKESLRDRMRPDPAFATSPICVTDKDYEFSVDPEIITLVESDLLWP